MKQQRLEKQLADIKKLCVECPTLFAPFAAAILDTYENKESKHD
jgi:hypothetical protein